MSRQGNLIPLHRQFPAGTETPVSVYSRIKERSFSYLLEGTGSEKEWGRYSVIGYRPLLIVISRSREVEIVEGDCRRVLKDIENPLLIVRDLIKRFKPVSAGNLSLFQGGFVGYCNYSLVRKWEHLGRLDPDHSEMPETIFTLSGRLIVFDHATNRIEVVALVRLRGNGNLEEVYDSASRDIHETVTELRHPLPTVLENRKVRVSPLKADFAREGFEEAVRRAKDRIFAGDAIQVVLSQRFSGDVEGDAFSLYENLRSINPSPYMFYLHFGDVRLIGSSPETLVRLTNGKIELRPIAGTRRRGKTPDDDLALEKELMTDAKERAEHVMLVDLGRNDVGKAAVPGSVTVPRLMDVERCSHVMHIVSTVEGLLKSEMDAFDLFMATFPAGTVTGAPKIRAMEIIGELEPTPRGAYAGAVGYFDLNGNMDFCITIRTITVAGQRLLVQAGAGIVADSDPEKEYEETLRKAAAMFKAIERVNER
jgi:anthranilate synthase component 1